MNNSIYKKFLSYHKSSQLSILPHQLATVDFLIDRVIEKKYNVLIYHKTGSGKTMIGTIFSILATQSNNKVIIMLPNQSLMEIWKDHQPQALTLLPPDDYNIDNIIFETKISFMKKILTDDENKLLISNKIKQYDNYIIIIDEAHNIFDNDVGKTLQKITEFINLRFVFLSGSPVTNTSDKIINIIELLDGKLQEQVILGKGKYVYDKQIIKEKLPLIEKKVEDKISYFIQNAIDIPKGQIEGYKIYQYPIVPCYMHEVQEKSYYDVVSHEKNMMFSKQVLNVSFAGLGDIDYSENTFKTNGKEKYLLPNLTVTDGVFKGKELYDLNFSAKLKKLVNTIKKNPCKRLIYFSNSSIGTLILKSVLPMHGLTEYGSSTVNNFLCLICKFEKTCKECIPVKYIIITSKEISISNININKILTVYNDQLNKDGRNLCLIFGSEVIEEGYTLKELKEIIFLTVPDSQSIMAQVTGRGIRSWSHEDPKNSTVVIKLFIATTKKDNINKHFESNKIDIISLEKTTIDTNINKERYKRFKKLLDDDNNNLSFDFRKILYLNLKHHGTKTVHKILKNASKLYTDYAHNDMKNVLLYEFLRQYFYNNNIYQLSSGIVENFFDNIIDINKTYIKNKIDKTSLNVYNKQFGYCQLAVLKDVIILFPFRLTLDPYLFKVNVENTKLNENLDYNKRVGNILLIYLIIENKYKIKLDTGVISNITTLTKTKLRDIGKKYLDINLDIKHQTTDKLIQIIIDRCKELHNTTDVIYYQEI